MALSTFLSRLRDETGITSLLASPRDVHLLLLTRFIRMFAYGSSTLILALFFAALGHSDTQIGLFMTLTLVGDVGISLALSLVADALGRRRMLVVGALAMALAGGVFATASSYWMLLAAAVVGVISPSGNEVGPFRAVEESTLAHLTDTRTGGGGGGTRADIFALYVVSGTLGAAGGTLVCGWLTQALQANGWSELASFRAVFWAYALAGLVKAALSMRLSARCEAQVETTVAQPRDGEGRNAEVEQEGLLSEAADAGSQQRPAPPQKMSPLSRISAKSRKTLAKLCGLFCFDSLASGMVPGSMIAYYLERKFDSLPRGYLGTIIAVSQFISSLGNMFASSVAKRIGLVRTMVFTHLPSAIFLALLPAPSSLILTIILLVARSSLSSMDQAPRSAFLSAVVLPQERTAVMGIVNTVKTTSQSAGPTITGILASDDRFWIAFVVAGGLKASYDVAMLAMFVNTPLEGQSNKPPTNRDDGGRSAREDDIPLSDLAEDDESDHTIEGQHHK